jgi:hypothetical protein
MDEVEKNRTFLFVDEINGSSRSPPTQCRAARQADPLESVVTPDNQQATTGRQVLLFGGEGEKPEVLPERIGNMYVIDQSRIPRQRGPGASITTSVLTYPELRNRDAVSWDGQNFFAHATDWEIAHSELVRDDSAVRVNFRPVLDHCGLVVGHYCKGVSTKDLWVDEQGELFYYKDFYSDTHNITPQTGTRFAGREVYLTADDKFMAWTKSTSQLSPEALTRMTHTRIPAANKADLLVDIEGYVLSIRMYDDPIWQASAAPTGGVLLFFLLDALTGVAEGCVVGNVDLDPDCHQHQGGARIFLFFAVTMCDMVASPPAGAAKLIYPVSRLLKQASGQATRTGGQVVLKAARQELRAATTLTLKHAARSGRAVLTSSAARPSGVGDLVSLPRRRGVSRALRPAEMEALLRDALRERPYLARLRVAGRLDGQALNDALIDILREWQAQTGKLYRVVPRGMVRRLGSQGVGGFALDSVSGREVLIIEQQAAARPRDLLRELRHELPYDAVREADGVPAVYLGERPQFANELLEHLVSGQNPQLVWQNLQQLDNLRIPAGD